MAKNIEEFLKMAAARRQQQQQAGGPAQPPRPQRAEPEIPEAPTRRLVEPEIIEIVDDVQVVDPIRTQSVGTHVATHIDTSDIAQHATQLGERVVSASRKTEARLHQKFDHAVGHLHDDSIQDIGEVSAASTTAYDVQHFSSRAADLVAMIQSPRSLSQAILLKEILERPNWD